jgi:hypothetical protein
MWVTEEVGEQFILRPALLQHHPPQFPVVDTSMARAAARAAASVAALAAAAAIMQSAPPAPVAINFLVSVNQTYATCIATSSPSGLIPRNEMRGPLAVGACDNGPIEWNVTGDGDVLVTFFSSTIADASPPACTIKGKDLVYTPPTAAGYGTGPGLPTCFVMDSREGYHMTQFWMSILEWT